MDLEHGLIRGCVATRANIHNKSMHPSLLIPDNELDCAGRIPHGQEYALRNCSTWVDSKA
jgi:hypothetical protein